MTTEQLERRQYLLEQRVRDRFADFETNGTASMLADIVMKNIADGKEGFPTTVCELIKMRTETSLPNRADNICAALLERSGLSVETQGPAWPVYNPDVHLSETASRAIQTEPTVEGVIPLADLMILGSLQDLDSRLTPVVSN
jgi:hypothetical protein